MVNKALYLSWERWFTAYALFKVPYKMRQREHHPSNQNSSQLLNQPENKIHIPRSSSSYVLG